MGRTPVLRSNRSSLRVVTRLGSRVGGGGGGIVVGVVSRGASLCLKLVVVRLRDGESVVESRLAARRRQFNAGLTVYVGVVITVVDLCM